MNVCFDGFLWSLPSTCLPICLRLCFGIRGAPNLITPVCRSAQPGGRDFTGGVFQGPPCETNSEDGCPFFLLLIRFLFFYPLERLRPRSNPIRLGKKGKGGEGTTALSSRPLRVPMPRQASRPMPMPILDPCASFSRKGGARTQDPRSDCRTGVKKV